MSYDLIRGACTPEAVGLKSADVLACLTALDASENEIHGFVAARHGKVFAETYLAPFGADLPHTCHSLGKSYTCTAVGVACTQGLLSPDDLVTDVFKEEIAQFGITPDENMRAMKLRHLMSMSCGMERMPDMNEHWEENFLRSPVKYAPGTQFYYNSVGSCMLGAAVEKVTGLALDAVSAGNRACAHRHRGGRICLAAVWQRPAGGTGHFRNHARQSAAGPFLSGGRRGKRAAHRSATMDAGSRRQAD